MKYMLLIHQGTALQTQAALPEAEQKQSGPPTRRSTRRPGSRPAERMDDPGTATTVRVENGSTLTTDGPFVDTKEALGGYFFFEADDLDAAIELAARDPRRALRRRDRDPAAWWRG